MQSQIEKHIREGLEPEHIDVVNESSKHNVPAGSESHFKLTVVSSAFEGRSLLERHQQINALLAKELTNGIHALSISALTPEEWIQKNGKVSNTPPCLGGSKSQ